MLDLSHLATSTSCDVQMFPGTATVENTQWSTWRRPRGTSMLFAICIGGGAPGGAGFTGTPGGGGGGGGSSAQSKVLVPSILLPETLYIQSGSAGILSYVAVAPNTTATNVLLRSGAAAPTGGGAGTGAAAGTAGSAGTIATIASMPLAGLGIYQLIAGNAGTAGGAQTGAVGAAQTIPVTSTICMGGTGGGGQNGVGFNGGLITAISNSLISEQRPQPALVATPDGSGGLNFNTPFFQFGGMGGASTTSGNGGLGGAGGYGAGGGGGGASAGTAGSFGPGGPGLVIMISW